MGFFTSYPNFDSMQSLFVDQLQDLYDAEQRLTKALPKMIDAASDPELKSAFQEHHRENQNQVSRLERIFDLIGEKAKPKACEAMKGLVDECEQMINAKGDEHVRDAALIAAAQRLDHYEMAGYGVTRTFAQQLGHNEAAQMLEESLNEEKAADSRLSRLAENQINVQAQTSGMTS